MGLAVLTGGFGLCAYAITYARAAPSAGPFVSALFATAAFVIAGLIVDVLDPSSLVLVAVAVAVVIAVAIRLVRAGAESGPRRRSPRWDIPARMIVGTTLVITLTTFAPILGARVSGLAATYPVYVTTLTVFAHRETGPAAAAALLRGLVLGLFGWLGFFVIVLTSMPIVGVLPAAGLAIAGALAIQGASLRLLRGSLTRPVREAVMSESVP